MKKFLHIKLHITGIIAILVCIGCGGPPQNNPLLVDAETRYLKMKNDSLVVINAPVALKEAEENLETSRTLWQDRAEDELVEHYAYISLQKMGIAREMAELNVAQQDVESAESRRKEVLLLSRKAEAAEQRALDAIEEAQRERAAAEKAREEAQNARSRVEEMADRINELEASQTERGLVLTLSDVLFDFNSAELNAGSKKVIDEITRFLNEYPERSILIEGFTDSIGSAEYNLELALRRADALRFALVQNGVSPHKIDTEAFGEQFPIATNMNEAGRQQNRRVEIVISDEDGFISQRSE